MSPSSADLDDVGKPESQALLYRAARELLTNIGKHAPRGGRPRVRVTGRDDNDDDEHRLSIPRSFAQYVAEHYRRPPGALPPWTRCWRGSTAMAGSRWTSIVTARTTGAGRTQVSGKSSSPRFARCFPRGVGPQTRLRAAQETVTSPPEPCQICAWYVR